MTSQQSDVVAFREVLNQLYNLAQGRDNIAQMRAKGWERFSEIGLPTRKNETYQYVKLRSLYERRPQLPQGTAIDLSSFSEAILPECSQSVIVLVNGYYSKELSRIQGIPKRAVILPLAEALKSYGTFLNNQWTSSLKEEKDPFAALSFALNQDGVFIYLPPKTTVEAPIQILHVITQGNESSLISSRVHIFVGSQSEVDLYSTQASLPSEKNLHCNNIGVDITIDENARVRYIQVSKDLPSTAWHFEALRATLKRDSSLRTVCATNGAQSVRFDYRIALTGENAEASLNGMWILKESRSAHAHIIMDHQAPNCRSMQLFKGALDDISHSSFEGKIIVRQAAQKTEAYQLNKNLLLGERASADSKPNLEIFADDVKASHGATVGQLDDDELFYMKSRGFPPHAAKNLLVGSFCKEIIDMIPADSLRNLLEDLLHRFLEKG